MDGYSQLKRSFEDEAKYQWGNLEHSPYLVFLKKVKEFNKCHNVELKIWFTFNLFTVYVDARRKHARNDKWMMIASKRMVPTMNEKYKGHIDLTRLTNRNKREVEPFLPEIERLFKEYL